MSGWNETPDVKNGGRWYGIVLIVIVLIGVAAMVLR